jgi:Glycosyltransferase family 87
MVRLRRLLVAAGVVLAVALVVVMTLTAEPFDPNGYGPGQDARAYWAVPITDPYTPGSVGKESAYLYSPAFLEALAPIRLLPWPLFLAVWTGLLLLVLRWLSGPLLFGPLIVLTFPELWGGNITILLAAMIVVGFRRPGVWAFAVLTKVTPALGLLWFVVRREWRALAEVGVVTAAIVAVSLLIAPQLWQEWIDLLRSSTGSSTVSGSVPIPLLLRLPVAAVVITWAALGDRRWALPIGVLLAMPVIWWGSFALLTASVALRRDDIERRLFGTGRAAVVDTEPAPAMPS